MGILYTAEKGDSLRGQRQATFAFVSVTSDSTSSGASTFVTPAEVTATHSRFGRCDQIREIPSLFRLSPAPAPVPSKTFTLASSSLSVPAEQLHLGHYYMLD